MVDDDGNGVIDGGDAFGFNSNDATGSSGADMEGEVLPPDRVQYMAQWAAACSSGFPWDVRR